MKNHDFHLKNGSRLIFHRSWPISTKKFRLMKKKFHRKIQKFFLVNFASIRMPLRCISWPVEVICPKFSWLTDDEKRKRRLQYIPFQLTGKVYCDRQLQARDMRAKVYHNTLNPFFFPATPLRVFGFAKLCLASPNRVWLRQTFWLRQKRVIDRVKKRRKISPKVHA